jgi:Icc-related predicted phosphoesterase
MKILHSSDLHGSYKPLLAALEGDYDIWIDTGDFFPNKTRGTAIEASYQTRWFGGYKGLGERIKARIGNRPMISVPGNHDFVNLAHLLTRSGVQAFDITDPIFNPSFPPFSFHSVRFAGFREIPYIAGEWNGEAHCFDDQINRVAATNPDILLTHAPPSGVLSDQWGIPALTTYLFYQPHRIKLHLFGHVHEHGGEEVTEGGIRFVNGATTIRTVEYEHS